MIKLIILFAILYFSYVFIFHIINSEIDKKYSIMRSAICKFILFNLLIKEIYVFYNNINSLLIEINSEDNLLVIYFMIFINLFIFWKFYYSCITIYHYTIIINDLSVLRTLNFINDNFFQEMILVFFTLLTNNLFELNINNFSKYQLEEINITLLFFIGLWIIIKILLYAILQLWLLFKY
ncbi:MAG: hypothetical protein CMF62_01500 [Magnetococcales bacterium]|nr:hypothetical protein [Magnetococcales bacterium]